MARVHLLATGPGYQTAPCVLSPQPEGSRDEEPPKIYLEVTPEWTGIYQQNVHVRYRISGASEVAEQICQTYSLILEDNEAIDTSCYGYPVSPNLNKEFDMASLGSHSFHLYARNASGQITQRYISIPVLQPIGYYNARTPGPVYRSTINALCGFLTKVEEKLKTGWIRTDTDLNAFPNSSYLLGELTDDIINKMTNVIIFATFSELPWAGRYDIEDGWLTEKDASWRLCYNGPPSPVYGFTGAIKDQTGLHRDWTSICYQNAPPNPVTPPEANGTTLLHELYHYAVREDQIDWDPNNRWKLVAGVWQPTDPGDPEAVHIEEAKAYVISIGKQPTATSTH